MAIKEHSVRDSSNGVLRGSGLKHFLKKIAQQLVLLPLRSSLGLIYIYSEICEYLNLQIFLKELPILAITWWKEWALCHIVGRKGVGTARVGFGASRLRTCPRINAWKESTRSNQHSVPIPHKQKEQNYAIRKIRQTKKNY